MKTEVRFYGQLTDVVGCRSMTLTADKISDLMEELNNRYPELRSKTFLTAMNMEIVSEDAVILPGSSVSLLPPFAGG